MSKLKRRDLLRIGSLGIVGAAVPFARVFAAQADPRTMQLALAPRRMPRPVPGPQPEPDPKMLLVFLRGGNDGANTVIPGGDPQYFAIRPTIAVDNASSLELNGFARLHPALGSLMELWNAGDLAVLHRIGYENQSLSHFSGQHFWETANPGDLGFEEGWIARLVDHALMSAFPAASVSSKLQRSFLSNDPDRVLAHVPNVSAYSLGSGVEDDKLRGLNPAAFPPYGSGLQGSFSQEPHATPFDELLRANGLAFIDSESLVSGLGTYQPENGASYPQNSADAIAQGLPPAGFTFSFMRSLEDAIQLLKETPCQIAGVEIGGFDTHSEQGAAAGRHANVLAVLAHGLRSAYRDMGRDPGFVSVAKSEFGRTSRENASFGTDHGKASVMFVGGNSVRGGVYNCSSMDGSWTPNATLLSANNKYIIHRTDFRTVLAELVVRHFGVPPTAIDDIIPGYSSLAGPEFDFLNFLS